MSSALRNAVKRKTHKERPQPANRKRLGLLEKKKDYRKRADDFHRKEKAIQNLQRKAEERNPDEFYFAMHRAQTKKGIHEIPSAEANKYSQEELRLMKSQDTGYLSLKASEEAKVTMLNRFMVGKLPQKLEKLRGSLHFLDAEAPPGSRHTFFVDSSEEASQLDPAQHLGTSQELLGRRANRPRSEQLEEAATLLAQPAASKSLAGSINRRRAAAYRELEERTARHQQLLRMAQRSHLTRQLMGPGNKQKQLVQDPETGASKASFQWKQVRQK